MSLRDCSIYAYAPDEDPYDGEEGALWRFDYFFFNKHRKRVCYIYLRGLSIISHTPNPKTPVKMKRAWPDDLYTAGVNVGTIGNSEPGSSKRARYWLGDREDVSFDGGWDDDDEEEEAEAEETGLEGWNEGVPIGKTRHGDAIATSPSMLDTESRSRSSSRSRSRNKSAVRGISEDMVESMDV